jgi:tetratricopeptide (TPR) repeat protein
MVRFGLWQDILREEAPPEDRAYSRGLYHYARALAFSRTGDAEAAEAELEALRARAADPALAGARVSGVSSASAVLAVAVEVTQGELAADRGELDSAVEHLERAVELEDQLRYMEPADWHHPTRQILGAILLRAGRVVEAERVYREDLARLPENGFSLFGLAQALEHQGREAETAPVRQRFEAAFAHADVTLESSRL